MGLCGCCPEHSEAGRDVDRSTVTVPASRVIRSTSGSLPLGDSRWTFANDNLCAACSRCCRATFFVSTVTFKRRILRRFAWFNAGRCQLVHLPRPPSFQLSVLLRAHSRNMGTFLASGFEKLRACRAQIMQELQGGVPCHLIL